MPKDDVVEAEVARLSSMSIAELRAVWRTMFKVEPPKASGPDLLRRSLAQKIQEDAYGGYRIADTGAEPPSAPNPQLVQAVVRAHN